MPQRRVSVIVPTRDRPAMLRQALASIRAQEGEKYAFEILLGDNGGLPETKKIAAEYGAVHLPLRFSQVPVEFQEMRIPMNSIGVVGLQLDRPAEMLTGQILITQRVLGKIETLVESEAVGELSLKGLARPLKAFWQITFPLTLPGIVTGALLVFIPMTGEYIIPNILGGGKYEFVGNLIGDQFNEAQNRPFGSALAISLMIALSVFVLVYIMFATKEERFGA